MIRIKLFTPILFLTWFFTSLNAHEPVFSLGPETIFKGGVGLEIEYEFEEGEDDQSAALHYEILYGLTKNITVTLSVPQNLDRNEGGESSSGLGDITFRGKYNFFRKDSLGAQHKITGIFGVKLPTGEDESDPPLGTGTTDVLAGLSYGYESRTWYHFVTFRYILQTERDGFNPGDRLHYDAAIGYRPWRREYLQWDFVALLEMSGKYEFSDTMNGRDLPNSSNNTIWTGVSGLFSYRNVMLKGGVQFTISQDGKGKREKNRIRAIFAFEYHF